MFPGLEALDFELFEIDGFEERMTVLRQQLSPKFAQLGAALKDELSAMVGDELFPHVAKHMRRKTNAPNDSWVAFGGKRGYKMGPHFQFCLWKTHALVQWGLIYEAQNKTAFAHNLLVHLPEVRKAIPDDYQWSKDHMKPEGIRQSTLSDENFEDLAHRLIHNKNGEIMVGKVIAKEDAIAMTPSELHQTVMHGWRPLVYLHRLASAAQA